MEDVLDTGAALPTPVVVWTSGEQPQYSLDKVSEHLYLSRATQEPRIVSEDCLVFHVDGVGAVGRRLVQQPSDVAADPLVIGGRLREFSMTLKGAVACHFWQPKTNVGWIVPDPLGYAIVFIYESPDETFSAASTSLRQLVGVVRRLGGRLTQSSDFMAELFLQDSGGFTPSPYHEVRPLKSLHALRFDSGGLREVEMEALETLVHSDRSYSDLLEEAVEEIKSSARAMADVEGPKTAHLTGGADSRLVLASLHAAGVSGDFAYYCRDVGIELSVAQGVAAHMGLTMTRSSGIRKVLTGAEPGQGMRSNLVLSEGVSSIGMLGGRLKGSGIILGGYHGETFRSMFGLTVVEGYERDAREFLRGRWKAAIGGQHRMIQSATLDRLAQRVDSFFTKALEAGAREDALADILYILTRNRFFTWHTPFQASRYTLQSGTLYSLAGNKLALSLSLESRSSGLIVFDLMKRLAPKALEVPFDKPKFSDLVWAQREKPRTADLASVGEPQWNNEHEMRAMVASDGADEAEIRPTRNDVQRARAVGGITPMTVACEPLYRGLLASRLRSDRDFLTQAFEYDSLRWLSNRPAMTRTQYRWLFRMRQLLSWYGEHTSHRS